jgi:hypothetical protein
VSFVQSVIGRVKSKLESVWSKIIGSVRERAASLKQPARVVIIMKVVLWTPIIGHALWTTDFHNPDSVKATATRLGEVVTRMLD